MRTLRLSTCEYTEFFVDIWTIWCGLHMQFAFNGCVEHQHNHSAPYTSHLPRHLLDGNMLVTILIHFFIVTEDLKRLLNKIEYTLIKVCAFFFWWFYSKTLFILSLLLLRQWSHVHEMRKHILSETNCVDTFSSSTFFPISRNSDKWLSAIETVRETVWYEFVVQLRVLVTVPLNKFQKTFHNMLRTTCVGS